MTTTPMVMEKVPVGTRKTEEGLDHTEAIGMVEARQMIQIQEGETDSIRDFEEDVESRGYPGPPGPEGPRGPPGPAGQKGDPGHVAGMGDMTCQLPNASTIAVENSLQYVGESLSRLMLTQQNVNRNMVDHLNLTAEAQDMQTHVLNKLVENTRQREFDKLFNAIPIYDGEDPDKFKP